MNAAFALRPAFTDAPRESQATFRAVMSALARPATLQPLAVTLDPPPPLTAELAAIALTLCDNDAPVWLDPPLAAEPGIAAWLRFHTGGTVVADPKEAAFALVSDAAAMPRLSDFAIGTEEYPDRSTTLIVAVRGFAGDVAMTIEGPGIRGSATFAPEPPPAAFAEEWRANRALFPRGVDAVFAGSGTVAALPRSSRLVREG